MSAMDRRRILSAAVGAAGAAAAANLLPTNLQRALAAPARPLASLADIKHVVIFMQENRSFDHYFGLMKGVRGFSDRSVVQLQTGRSVFHQPSGSSYVLPYRTRSLCMNGTPHGWTDGQNAVNGGKWDKWVPYKGKLTMAHYGPEELPFYYQLADNFTICDAYHCSVIGPTCPNRLHLCTGTSGGYVDNSMGEANPICTWTTYAERLQAAGISWRVYQEEDNFDDNAFAYFRQFANARPGNPLYDRGMVKMADLVATFKADVQNNRLPAVSWVVAPESKSEHSVWGPGAGSLLCKRLLDALAANATVWNKSVFFLNYDENDGFFDHVPSPLPPPGTTGEFVGGKPLGLGVRVPMIVVSPFSRGGKVFSQTSDHTSVLRFLEKWTGVREPQISAWRRTVCSDLTGTLVTATPGYPALPTPADPGCSGSGTSPAPPTDQKLPVQQAGTRVARPLPYQHTSAGRVDKAAGRFWISLGNTGAAAAHFAIFCNRYRTDGPYQYTVGAGASTEDYFSVQSYGGGKYDLSVFGPNRFMRRFTGDINAGGGKLAVKDEIDLAEGGMIWLTLVNSSTATVRFTVTATGYRGDGPWTYDVAAGASVRDYWHQGWNADGWYDLTVTANGDASWSQRFVGHIEMGTESVTG